MIRMPCLERSAIWREDEGLRGELATRGLSRGRALYLAKGNPLKHGRSIKRFSSSTAIFSARRKR